MSDRYDAVIIGAGHNGLTCAAYLARSGRKVLVLEAAKQTGGAAISREFCPGFSVSACAHLLYLLHPEVVNDLALAKYGLHCAAQDLSTIALSEIGAHLILTRNAVNGVDLSEKDTAGYPAFMHRMRRYAGILDKAFLSRPPRLVHKNRQDILTLIKLALNVRLLGRDDMRELLRIGAINIFDVLQEEFDSGLLKGALAFDAVLGANMGPRSPNSVLSYLYRLSGQVHSHDNAISLPKGGMGAVTNALAAAGQALGVEIRTGCEVAGILTNGESVTGVKIAGGEQLKANLVISNADPKTTILDLLGAGNIETGFARRIKNIRMAGCTAKLHLALDGLPAFSDLDQKLLGHRLLIAPSMSFIEHAFDHSKYGEYSSAPTIEITLPSIHDSDIAPGGKHVLSAIVQYAPYNLRAGWADKRDSFRQLVIDRIAAYAPDLKTMIIDSEILTPADIEKEFRIHGGHWHHGEFALDQFLMLRPVPGAAQYATPVTGLYFCSAGAHPGGGVMGLAGRNAAREIIQREQAA